MKYIIDLKYTTIGLVIALVVGYGFSTFTGIPLLAAFSIIVVAMFVNGVLAEYEDNLPGGFNNPMSEKEIKIENEKRKKRFLPLRIALWVVFISLLIWLTWMHGNKSV